MLSRATNRLAPEDFVLLKLQTTREEDKDVEGIILVLEKKGEKFRWNVLFEEMKNQLVNYSKKEKIGVVRHRLIEIGYKLEEINKISPRLVSGEIMDRMNKLYDQFETS